jgi:hypothetical protein
MSAHVEPVASSATAHAASKAVAPVAASTPSRPVGADPHSAASSSSAAPASGVGVPRRQDGSAVKATPENTAARKSALVSASSTAASSKSSQGRPSQGLAYDTAAAGHNRALACARQGAGHLQRGELELARKCFQRGVDVGDAPEAVLLKLHAYLGEL